MTPREARTPKGAATRAELLRVAGEVFASKGYASSRMEDVIAASGLTKGAIYFHFASKAELAQAVVLDHQERWLARVGEEVLALVEPRDQLLGLVPFLTKLVAGDPTAWTAGRLARELAVELGGAQVDPLTDWVALVEDILIRGRADGQLRFESGARDLAVVLVGAFDGTKSLTDAVDAADPEVFARRGEILQMLVESLLTP